MCSTVKGGAVTVDPRSVVRLQAGEQRYCAEGR